MRRNNGAYTPILLSTKTRRLPSASCLRTSSSTNQLWHPAGSCTSSMRRMTSASLTTLCSMWLLYLCCCSFVLLAAATSNQMGQSCPNATPKSGAHFDPEVRRVERNGVSLGDNSRWRRIALISTNQCPVWRIGLKESTATWLMVDMTTEERCSISKDCQ